MFSLELTIYKKFIFVQFILIILNLIRFIYFLALYPRYIVGLQINK